MRLRRRHPNDFSSYFSFDFKLLVFIKFHNFFLSLSLSKVQTNLIINHLKLQREPNQTTEQDCEKLREKRKNKIGMTHRE